VLLDPRPRLLAPAPMRTGVLWPALACLVVAGLSLLLPSNPTYDPWAWIIWGREITQLDLVTSDGPSWKPLPVLFTVPFALLGDGVAPDLWMFVARAGALAGLFCAFRLGTRLGGPGAGALAVVAVALAAWSVRNAGLGNSEGLLVLCVLWAADRHLDAHRAHAFALGVAAGLLRPEAWPFLGLYALWLVWEERRRLPWVAGGLAVLPVLWLLPERWGSGNLFRAAERANAPNPDSPAFAASPALAIFGDAAAMLGPVVLVGLALALGLGSTGRASAGRGREAAGLGALAFAWIALVAVMTEAGYAGNQRYLVAPAALACILGAAGLSWAVAEVALRSAARSRRTIVALAAVLCVGGLVFRAADQLPPFVRAMAFQAKSADNLGDVLAAAGGEARLQRCGMIFTNPFLVPLVAWTLERHSDQVDFRPRPPAVVLRAAHVPDRDPDPPPGALARVPGRRIVARSPYWEVEVACSRG